MSAVDDRRKALVKLLAKLGQDTDGFAKKAVAQLGSNQVTVEKDLLALLEGSLPAGDVEGNPEAHGKIAKQVRGIKTDEDAAKCMIELGAGVLDGDLDPKRVTVAQGVLMGMRYYTPRAEGSEKTGKGHGGPITALPAAPAFDPFAPRAAAGS